MFECSTAETGQGRSLEDQRHYREVFDALDEGFCICDMITDEAGVACDYRFLAANPLFEAMTGLSAPVGRTALELVPGLERHWIDTYARVGLGRETLRFQLPSDAMGRWFDVFATPLSVDGRFALVFRDVTDRKRGEEALRESEALFRTVSEAMPQMVWSARPDGHHDYFNQRWYDFTGAAPGETDGQGWRGLFHPDDHPEIERRWSHALATGATYEIEYRLRHRGGGFRWVLGRALPVRDGQGTIVRWMGTCTDIHEMKQAQQRQLLLLQEMEHRVKNILALVHSVAQQTFGALPEAAAAREAFAGRLGALGSAYGHLNHESWSQASLRHVILTSLEGCGAAPGAVTLEGPDLMLPPRQAVTLSMAIHELGTNGVKYGALSVTEGRVRVVWQLAEGGSFQLLWQEEGGPPVAVPGRRGFGTRMIEDALAAEMEGKVQLDFAPEGVRCTLTAVLVPAGD